MRAKQFSFSGSAFQQQLCFGGSLLKGHARSKRPLDTRLPLHLVLRADLNGRISMRDPTRFNKVNDLVKRLCCRYGISLYEYANVGNHLHLLIRVPNRHLWGSFIRALTGRIAQLMQGISGQEKGSGFWLYKPFTRVVSGWKKAFEQMRDYVVLNRWEAEGIHSRRNGLSLRELRELWAEPG